MSAPALILPHTTQTWPRLLRAARALPRVASRVIVDDAPETSVTALVGAALGRGAAILVPRAWPASRRADALAAIEGVPLPRGAATVVFTSGSTGTPKAVVHTLDNHIRSAAGAHARVPFAPPHRWLLSLPLCHIGGTSLVFRALLYRAALVAPEPGASLPASIERTGATHVSLVARQLQAIVAQRGQTSAEILVGGGPVSRTLLNEAWARGLSVRPTWGMTETCAQVCTAVPADAASVVGDAVCCGSPLPGREVQVREGRLWVKGPVLAPVRIVDGVATKLVGADGWFDSGDEGRIDARGRVFITGRAGTRFISGGYNIAPEEIERVLLAAVPRCCVVDVPSAKWGARPVAFVPPGSDIAALGRLVKTELPRYMWPDAYLDWPVGMDGLKPPRAQLRSIAQARR